MKTKNKTAYDTRYLRKLFMACEKQIRYVYMSYADKSIYAFHENRHVTIQHSKNRRVGGYAYYNSGTIVMKIPPPVGTYYGNTRENAVSARHVAQVYLHEIGHNLGLKHKQQISSHKLNADFWPDETLPLKQIKTKPKRNVVDERAKKAHLKLVEWQKKLNKAKTFVKKYRRKVKYYEKKKAANH